MTMFQDNHIMSIPYYHGSETTLQAHGNDL